MEDVAATIDGRSMQSGIGSSGAKRRWLGLISRRERWGLTFRGWLVLSLGTVGLGLILLVTVQPFLALTRRVDAPVLVVEGWMHDYAIRAAAEEFRTNGYQRIFTTGGPVKGTGDNFTDYQTSASVGATLLRESGIAAGLVQMVPCRVRRRDRTYHSAVALREWFQKHNLDVHSINVVTENTHARRTRFLFQKALGPEVKVGIIALPDPDYDPKRWWESSEGFRDVTGEIIAYLYARLRFYPSAGALHPSHA